MTAPRTVPGRCVYLDLDGTQARAEAEARALAAARAAARAQAEAARAEGDAKARAAAAFPPLKARQRRWYRLADVAQTSILVCSLRLAILTAARIVWLVTILSAKVALWVTLFPLALVVYAALSVGTTHSGRKDPTLDWWG